MARSVPKFLGWGAIGVIAVASLVSASVYVVTYHPDAIENEAIVSTAPAPQAKPGQKLKVLSWNVQFFAGRPNNKFFFDGGTDPWPSQRMVNSTAIAVANIIKQEDPDIIFLQELDDGAERTRYHDQLQQLLDLLPAKYVMHTSSFYWLADYVPHGELLGGVGMKMSIISRYRIEHATRYALPNITTDDIFTEQFKPKRAVHGAYLPIEGGGSVNILNTHLSAYAQGTNTMALQVASVGEVLRDIEAKGESAILAGDFNLVPTDSAYQELGAGSRRYYNPTGTEIAPLFDHYKSVPSLSETLGDDHQDWFTHIANDNRSEMPDKTIDYIFYTGELILGDHYVRSSDTLKISDHLPIVATFTLPALRSR